MTAERCAEIRQDLGAYVLGALSEAEAANVREHLAECAECRAEHDELMALRPLLSATSLEEIQAVEPAQERTDELGLARTLHRVRATRAGARRRRVLAIAAAAVLVVAVGAGGWATSRWVFPPQPSGGGAYVKLVGEPVNWSATDETTNVEADITMNPVPWGTRIDISLRGVDKGKTCELLIVDKSGREWRAGSWEVAYSKGVTWSGGVGVPTDRIREVVVVLIPDDKPVVTVAG